MDGRMNEKKKDRWPVALIRILHIFLLRKTKYANEWQTNDVVMRVMWCYAIRSSRRKLRLRVISKFKELMTWHRSDDGE